MNQTDIDNFSFYIYQPTFFVKYDKWILLSMGLVIFIILNLIAYKGGIKLFEKKKSLYIYQVILGLYTFIISFFLTIIAHEVFDFHGFYWSKGLPDTGVIYGCKGFIALYGAELVGAISFLVLILLSFKLAFIFWRENKQKRKFFLRYSAIYHIIFSLTLYYLIFLLNHRC